MGLQGVDPTNVRARIEILEERLVLIGGPGGTSTATFAGPIVANEAAMVALTGIADGKQVFVLSHRSIWTKRNGVAGTQGVPPLFPHEVDQATDLSGVFCRTTYSDPALRIGINDLFIDPAAGTSNDENDGLTAGTALKTGYELFRRWGWNDSKPLISCNLATSPDGFLSIHVLSDLVSPDSLPIKVTVAHDVSVRVTSPLLAGNILRTATLTDAVIASNRAAPLGGTRLTVRDNTLAGWTAFEVPNRRVRMLNGPAAGGTLQPQTDALATPGQVQCSNCQTTNEPGFSLVPTTVTPAVGNTYVVEQLVQVNLGSVDIDQELNPTFGGFEVFFNFVNINLPAIGTQFWLPRSAAGTTGAFLNFYQCTVDRNVDVSRSNCVFVACYVSGGGPGGFLQIVGAGQTGFNGVFEGGGANAAAGQGGMVFAFNPTLIDQMIDSDFIVNRCEEFSVTNGSVKNCASWNCLGFAGGNTAGHGFHVGAGGSSAFFGDRGATMFKGTLWGNGNLGAGMQIGSGCTGVGPPQNITGAQGDCKLADFSSTVGNNTFWQAATGLDVGATGVAGVVSAASWALIAAAKGAPGYGGSVHNRDQNASFVANETTA